ncbi:hypothetical protein [Oceanirhabdus seepicola]|uniref:Uncharacterized protein n=1 Tax=Oceanirhabdus seepicola TaxID=2828781 RepID=A0A9J6P4C4_9CLOT|nr:hypothetical protein [Oceanirhabdus seepicola]MCM1991634.1 hypothetical protein [Oceanirhabdus seepicola]
MAKEEKKSILRKLFGNSGGCSCGVEIVEQEEVKNEDTSKSKKAEK